MNNTNIDKKETLMTPERCAVLLQGLGIYGGKQEPEHHAIEFRDEHGVMVGGYWVHDSELSEYTIQQLASNENVMKRVFQYAWIDSPGINFEFEAEDNGYFLVMYDFPDIRDSSTWTVVKKEPFTQKELVDWVLDRGITDEELLGVNDDA